MNSLDKEKEIRLRLRGLGRVVIAFSGGVDSSYLVKLAKEEKGGDFLAVTARSPSFPQRERKRVARFVERWEIPHRWIDTGETELPDYIRNPPRRCYHCKKAILQALATVARDEGCSHLLDGENTEDAGDFRPGSLAAKEIGVLRLLADAGMTKDEIRERSRALGLEDAERPASPCLASRIAYGTPVTVERLRLVERIEDALLAWGFSPCRARIEGQHLRIEVASEAIETLIVSGKRLPLVEMALAGGMKTVSLDLEGFVSGKLNRMVHDE